MVFYGVDECEVSIAIEKVERQVLQDETMKILKKDCQTLKTVSNLIGLYPFLKCHQSFNWSTDTPIALASFTRVAVRCSLSILSI